MLPDFARLWAIFVVVNRGVEDPSRPSISRGMKLNGNTACDMVVGIARATPRRNDLNLAPLG